MKLKIVLGENAYRQLMNWEDKQGEAAIGYELSSDGNPNGLTAKSYGERNTVIDELTVYGDMPVAPWLDAYKAQGEEWNRQLSEQDIKPGQYGVGNLSCPIESLFE